jgi:hypothetical protein
MNHWHLEVLAEQRRKEIRQEAAHMHLERVAASRLRRRRVWLGRSMLSLADWMIATGRELRCRYDTAADCRHDLGSSLAR